jgi:hypothetical protein
MALAFLPGKLLRDRNDIWTMFGDFGVQKFLSGDQSKKTMNVSR